MSFLVQFHSQLITGEDFKLSRYCCHVADSQNQVCVKTSFKNELDLRFVEHEPRLNFKKRFQRSFTEQHSDQ